MKKAKTTALALKGYPEFLGELKQRIASARLHAARAVNRELIPLYWDIGQEIMERKAELQWGQSVIERLAKDLLSPCHSPVRLEPQRAAEPDQGQSIRAGQAGEEDAQL